VYALKTKVITLRRSGRVEAAKATLNEAINLLAKYPRIEHLAWELEELWVEFE
jgi:hypothetical protein